MFVTGRDSEQGDLSEGTEMTQWHYGGLAAVGKRIGRFKGVSI